MFDWIRLILDLIFRQTSKENFRNKSIRKTRIEMFEDKMAKESNALEYMGDDFILKALTTEPRQIKWLIADESSDSYKKIIQFESQMKVKDYWKME